MMKNSFFICKRLLLIVLATVLLLAIMACEKTEKDPSPNDNIAQIEEELGNIQQLPLDLNEAVAAVGKDADIYINNNSESERSQALAVFDSTLMYSTISSNEETTEDGVFYTFTNKVLHFGTYTRNADGSLNPTFSAANLVIEIVSEDVAAARADMKRMIEDAPLSKDTLKLYNDLVDGETGYLTADSPLWEEFIDVGEDIKIFCNEDNSFDIVFSGDSNELLIDEVRGENDELISRVSYYYDQDGNNWIESIEENTYLEDGSMESTVTYYYYNSNQIKTTSRTRNIFESTETGGTMHFILLMEKKYYENGQIQLDYESYTGEKEGTYKEIAYFENGQMQYQAYFDEEGYRIQEHYLESGMLISWEKYLGEELVDYNYPELPDNITLPEEEVLEDGTVILREFHANGNLYRELQYKNNILVYETEYYENKRISCCKEYSENTGELYSLESFYDDEDSTKKEACYYSGYFYLQRETYYPNGQMHIHELWFTEEQQYEYVEWYENGVEKISRQYDEAGNIQYIFETYDNGNPKYNYYIAEGGFFSEDFYYENGNLQSAETHFEDGSHRLDRYNEDGIMTYQYFWYPEGWGYEDYYDDNGDFISSTHLEEPLHE